jgi:hypothetical protein
MLPKFITRWVDKQIETAWWLHKEHCAKHGVDPHDVDAPESWREKLHFWFPEAPDMARSIDWTEIVDSITIPIHRRLRLCKLGWHMWGCYYDGRWHDDRPHANCTICGTKRYGYTPRWARK